MKSDSNIPIIILGAGGHAKVIAEALIQAGFKVKGLTSPDKSRNVTFFGLKVLGTDEILSNFSPSEVMLANGIGTLPGGKLRWKLAKRMRENGFVFTQVIHPSSVVALDVELAEGVQIMAGSVIQTNVRIGQDSIINTGTLIDHDCQIAENCHIAPGVVCSGGVKIGKGTHLGTGTTVIQNISIGRNTVIGAGTTIYKNVAANTKFVQSLQSKTKLVETSN